MLPLYIAIRLQSRQVAEAALETSPYNAIAYGVLVTVLIFAVVFIWRQYKKTLERHRDYVEKTVGLMQLIESRMDTIEEIKDTQQDLIDRQKDVKRELYNLKEHVDRNT